MDVSPVSWMSISVTTKLRHRTAQNWKWRSTNGPFWHLRASPEITHHTAWIQNLAYHSLLRWKVIVYKHYLTYTFVVVRCKENTLLNLEVKVVTTAAALQRATQDLSNLLSALELVTHAAYKQKSKLRSAEKKLVVRRRGEWNDRLTDFRRNFSGRRIPTKRKGERTLRWGIQSK